MGDHEKVILLDTHVLAWLTGDPEKLSKQAAAVIRRAHRAGGIAISAITLWELAWLVSHNRLQVTGTVEAYLEEVLPASPFARSLLKLPSWPTSLRPTTPVIHVTG
jgi:PIN domain nuclease of toxin-antitoxin system